MKKINITNLTIGDKSAVYTKRKRHTLFLGNNVSVYFSDIKKAKAFLAETNRFLNEKLFEINALYIDIFQEYRKAWFYLFDKKANNIIIDFDGIENQMKLMVNRSHFKNGSTIVFKGFFYILSVFHRITNDLIELYKTKKQYSQAHQLKSIITRIEIVNKQLNDYGKNMPEITIYR